MGTLTTEARRSQRLNTNKFNDVFCTQRHCVLVEGTECSTREYLHFFKYYPLRPLQSKASLRANFSVLNLCELRASVVKNLLV